MIKKSMCWGWICAALAAGLAGGLGLLFGHWTATLWLAWPRFLLAVALLFLLPGWLVFRSLKLAARPLETLALSLALGLILACVLHVLQTWLGIGWPLRLWVLAGAGHSAWRSRATLAAWRSASVSGVHALLLLALAAVWLPLLCLPFYYRDLALLPTGGMSYADIPDLGLHTSLTAELARHIPPQAPFLAGEPLSYHIGMDLVAAVLHRHGGIAVMDLIVRFCPTFFIAFDVLAVFVLSRRFTGSAGAGVATAVLVILGEDLAFIPGLLDRSPGAWCAEYFGAPTIVSLYFFNPMVLAVGLLFVTLLSFQRVLARGGAGWFVVGALCAAALIQVKFFVFAQLLLAAGPVLLVAWFTPRRGRMLALLASIALAGAPLVFLMARQNTHAGAIAWTWVSGWAVYIAPAFRTHGHWLLACAPLAVAAYLALTFGLRLAGLGVFLRAFCRPRRRLFALLLALFVVSGPLLSLLGRVAPAGNALAYNNAIWFLVAGKYVAWLFAVAALARIWRRHGWRLRTALVALAAMLTLPGSIQFVTLMPAAYPTQQLAPATWEALAFLGRTAAPGAVVLSTLAGPLHATTALHTPLGTPFAGSFISEQKVDARARDLAAFHEAWQRGESRADILARYQVAWILMPRALTGMALQAATPAFSKTRITLSIASRAEDGFRVTTKRSCPGLSSAPRGNRSRRGVQDWNRTGKRLETGIYCFHGNVGLERE